MRCPALQKTVAGRTTTGGRGHPWIPGLAGHLWKFLWNPVRKLGLVRVWGFRCRKINFYLKILGGFSNMGTFQGKHDGTRSQCRCLPWEKGGLGRVKQIPEQNKLFCQQDGRVLVIAEALRGLPHPAQVLRGLSLNVRTGFPSLLRPVCIPNSPLQLRTQGECSTAPRELGHSRPCRRKAPSRVKCHTVRGQPWGQAFLASKPFRP